MYGYDVRFALSQQGRLSIRPLNLEATGEPLASDLHVAIEAFGISRDGEHDRNMT